jgi:hypothetical protein
MCPPMSRPVGSRKRRLVLRRGPRIKIGPRSATALPWRRLRVYRLVDRVERPSGWGLLHGSAGGTVSATFAHLARPWSAHPARRIARRADRVPTRHQRPADGADELTKLKVRTPARPSPHATAHRACGSDARTVGSGRSARICGGKTLACLPGADAAKHGGRSLWVSLPLVAPGEVAGIVGARAMTVSTSWPCTWPRRGKSRSHAQRSHW